MTDYVNLSIGSGNSFAGFMLRLEPLPSRGVIFKFGYMSNGTNAVLTVAPVPLPASLPMLAAGLGLIGLYRRRRS